MSDTAGYWGDATSTIDWCEGNYLVSSYVAEWMNSWTSFFIVAAGLLPIVIHGDLWPLLEWRYLLVFLSIAIVGFGSVAFHGTLQFEHQMLDEVPMLWTVCIMLFCLLEQHQREPCYGFALPVLLTVYALVATAATAFQGGNSQWYSFHTMFDLAEVFSIILVVRLFWGLDKSFGELKTLMFGGTVVYISALGAWLIDLNLCKQLQILPGYDYWNLHAWGWHLLVSVGLYRTAIGVWYYRLRIVLGVDVRLVLGWLPHIRRGKP